MTCIDITEQFRSYVDSHTYQSSYFTPSTFMKSCNDALTEIQTLKLKVKELETSTNMLMQM